jgi:hypothetical protein
MSSAEILPGNYLIRVLTSLFGILYCEEAEYFLSEELFYGIVVHHTFSCDARSDCSVPEELLALVRTAWITPRCVSISCRRYAFTPSVPSSDRPCSS